MHKPYLLRILAPENHNPTSFTYIKEHFEELTRFKNNLWQNIEALPEHPFSKNEKICQVFFACSLIQTPIMDNPEVINYFKNKTFANALFTISVGAFKIIEHAIKVKEPIENLMHQKRFYTSPRGQCPAKAEQITHWLNFSPKRNTESLYRLDNCGNEKSVIHEKLLTVSQLLMEMFLSKRKKSILEKELIDLIEPGKDIQLNELKQHPYLRF